MILIEEVQESQSIQQKKEEDSFPTIKTMGEQFSKDWWKSLITEDWWSDMSSQEQEDYIEKHPRSQKAVQKKEKEKKVKLRKKVKNVI